MIRGSRDIEEALLEHLGVKRNGSYIHGVILIISNLLAQTLSSEQNFLLLFL
jgi:hypothetical protein